MFEDGRLTESAKRSMIILLNKSLEMEYAYTVNYPRLIDQLLNSDRIPDPDKRLRRSLEDLGKRSVEHFHWTARLIEDLGGEPQWRIAAIDRIVDVPAMLLTQLENEKASVALFEQVKNVAEHPTGGVLARMKTMLDGGPGHATGRSSTIRLLEQMSRDEEEHVAMLKNIISELNFQAEK